MTEFQIYCASIVAFISQSKLHKPKIQDRHLSVKSVANEIRNVFYSATEDVIKIIGRIDVRTDFRGWISEGAELFLTYGGQRDTIGNILCPSLGMSASEASNTRGTGVVEGPQDHSQAEFSTIERKYSKTVLSDFEEKFERKDLPKIVKFELTFTNR